MVQQNSIGKGLPPIGMWLIVAMGFMFASGCIKNDVDPSTLTNNPFDPGYSGPNVFAFDTTYTEVVNGGQATFTRQVFQFTVNSNLFLAPQSYEVRVEDTTNGVVEFVPQSAPGSDVIRFYRLDFTFGQEVCLRVALSNNLHPSRTETVCGTL